MLWALVSSAYVVYLYKKLNGAGEQPSVSKQRETASLEADLDALNQRLASLDERLSAAKGRGIAQ
jgi:hypothetical protein